jgi:uncharacterized repeat protein (TIGR03843 family)
VSDGQSLEELLDATVHTTDPGCAELLRSGTVEVHGRMPWSSNATYLVSVDDGTGGRIQAIYKPESGERPLWDFPTGLWRREVAFCDLARTVGWDVVPVTISRTDAPLGIGSLQAFVPSRFEEHYFTFRDRPELTHQIQQICLLDLLANNTDRKGGHVLLDHHDRLWAIDHGVAFSAEFKLRTVLWDYAQQPIPADLAADIAALIDRGLPDSFDELLSSPEREAVLDRARTVLTNGRFPSDPTGRRYPWPLV